MNSLLFVSTFTLCICNEERWVSFVCVNLYPVYMQWGEMGEWVMNLISLIRLSKSYFASVLWILVNIIGCSNNEHKNHYKAWKKIKHIHFNVYENDCLKQYFAKMEVLKSLRFMGERSQTTDKCLVRTLMSTLTTMKFNEMHEHVIEMINIVAVRPKTSEMTVNIFLYSLFWTHYYLSSLFKWSIVPWMINELYINCKLRCFRKKQDLTMKEVTQSIM